MVAIRILVIEMVKEFIIMPSNSLVVERNRILFVGLKQGSSIHMFLPNHLKFDEFVDYFKTTKNKLFGLCLILGRPQNDKANVGSLVQYFIMLLLTGVDCDILEQG